MEAFRLMLLEAAAKLWFGYLPERRGRCVKPGPSVCPVSQGRQTDRRSSPLSVWRLSARRWPAGWRAKLDEEQGPHRDPLRTGHRAEETFRTLSAGTQLRSCHVRWEPWL